MRLFYLIATADLQANRPQARHHALDCDTGVSLVVVEEWHDTAAQDAWERIASVTEHHPWGWARGADQRLMAALASHGAQAGDTLADMFRKVRDRWPPCRP